MALPSLSQSSITWVQCSDREIGFRINHIVARNLVSSYSFAVGFSGECSTYIQKIVMLFRFTLVFTTVELLEYNIDRI